MPELRIRAAGRVQWLAFFAALLLGWLALFAMAVPAELRGLERSLGTALIDILCGGTLSGTGYGGALAMWALMAAAMMAPTALPAFVTYDNLGHVAPTAFGRLVGGYLLAWLGFSALAAAAQIGLYRLGLLGSLGQSLSAPLTACLLAAAGAYQFTPLKEACLSRCRAPLSFFLQHWDEGPLRNGLRLGLDCIGCCWALMLLAFIGGTMNLAFMGLAMLLMTLEKLPDLGRRLTRPLGAVLLAAAPVALFI